MTKQGRSKRRGLGARVRRCCYLCMRGGELLSSFTRALCRCVVGVTSLCIEVLRPGYRPQVTRPEPRDHCEVDSRGEVPRAEGCVGTK